MTDDIKTRIAKLPQWAQDHIAELEWRVKRAEATIPWTEPGMEWFTLFGGATKQIRVFTCDQYGTHLVCSVDPEDRIFVGRGKKPQETA